MQQYLERAIRWMGAYGVPVILVSATLPQDKRKDLAIAYLRGMGVRKNKIDFPEDMSGISYPMISYSEGKGIKVQTDFPSMEDKTIQVNNLDEDNLNAKLAELLDGGGVVGIIVNTVRKAQKLGEECKKIFGESTVVVLHSAFIATDRVKKESALIKLIGKRGKRPEKMIIIGTQVIEQSLDIDFDVLITDLCPIDLLLQRIGRLHRHDIKRPQKHKEAVVYVMGINDRLGFDKGSEKVYGKFFLIQTQKHLPSKIRIPSDIPILIGKVYGNDEQTMEEDLNSVYRESYDEMVALRDKRAYKAKTYCIEKPYSKIEPDKYNLIGWLKNPDYSESEEMAAAQVRDTMETIEIIAVKKMGDGYGTFDKNEDVSGKIQEPHIAKELAKQTIRLPNYVSLKRGIGETIKYLENYNFNNLRIWREQPWLRGSLGLIFDENGRVELSGIMLKYDNEFGLREEKDYGKI